MTSRCRPGRRPTRGTVEWLPSGSARLRVYAGVDQLTGKKLFLRETVAARSTRRETEREAEKVLTRLLNQVDERRSPRTEATVNELLDRWLAVIDVERTTRAGYVGKIEKHIRPTIGHLQVGRVQVETIETLYAQLRRCRDHCRGRAFVQHRTAGGHVCDEHSARRKCAKVITGNPEAACRYCSRACRPHRCEPLAAGSIRVVHAILSGTFQRAVRWGWIAVSPIERTEPPPTPRPNPDPPTPEDAALIVNEAWKDPEWGLFVWTTLTTGARRGEMCNLRWNRLDLANGVAVFRRSAAQIGGEIWEKDVKNHQDRRVTLDEQLVELLRSHRASCERNAAAPGRCATACRSRGSPTRTAPRCAARMTGGSSSRSR